MKTKRPPSLMAVLIALFVGNLTILASAQVPSPDPRPKGTVVTLMRYSGFRNPSLELKDADLKQIEERIEKLSAGTEESVEAPPQMGYAGFRIAKHPASESDQRVSIRVYRNRVELYTFLPGKAPVVTLKRDDKRSLETFLLVLFEAHDSVSPDDKADVERVGAQKKKT